MAVYSITLFIQPNLLNLNKLISYPSYHWPSSQMNKKYLSKATSRLPPRPTRVNVENGFNPEEYVKPGLSVEEIQLVKSYFDEFADPQTGLIKAVELREILESFGQIAQENELHYTFQVALGTYGPQSMDRQINFEQFLYLLTDTVSQKDSRTDMKRLFNLYDDDRNGYLTKDKLRHIADEYGIWVAEEDLEKMISCASREQEGKVKEEEFYQLMAGEEVKKI